MSRHTDQIAWRLDRGGGGLKTTGFFHWQFVYETVWHVMWYMPMYFSLKHICTLWSLVSRKLQGLIINQDTLNTWIYNEILRRFTAPVLVLRLYCTHHRAPSIPLLLTRSRFRGGRGRPAPMASTSCPSREIRLRFPSMPTRTRCGDQSSYHSASTVSVTRASRALLKVS